MKIIKKAIRVGAEDFITFTIVGCNGYHRWFPIPTSMITRGYRAGRRHVAQMLRDVRQEVRRSELTI